MNSLLPKNTSSGFAEGHVIHHRSHPREHRFKYNMSWFLIDLDHVESWKQKSKLYAHNRWSLYGLYDSDHIDPSQRSIRIKLFDFLTEQGVAPHDGATILFTHPRFLGFAFNSVNFYFCYENDSLLYIVSEINNTPWGEKHLYLHQVDKASRNPDGSLRFEFKKKFHISPFMEMDIDYRWDFKISNEVITVKMLLNKNNVKLLSVVLDTIITPDVDNGTITVKTNRIFQPIKMWLGIYWQALKLWVKRVPFYSHPDKT